MKFLILMVSTFVMSACVVTEPKLAKTSTENTQIQSNDAQYVLVHLYDYGALNTKRDPDDLAVNINRVAPHPITTKPQKMTADECVDLISTMIAPENYITNGVHKYGAGNKFSGYRRSICVKDSDIEKYKWNGKYDEDRTAFLTDNADKIAGVFNANDFDGYSVLPLDDDQVRARNLTMQLNAEMRDKTFQTSFNCHPMDKLKRNEYLVCRTKNLAQKDVELDGLYKTAVEYYQNDPEKLAALKKSQRDFVKRCQKSDTVDSLRKIYDVQITHIKYFATNCDQIDAAAELIDVDNVTAVKILNACVDAPNVHNNERMLYNQAIARLLLTYIYLGNDNLRDMGTASNHMKYIVDTIKTECSKEKIEDNFSNLCFVYHSKYSNEKIDQNITQRNQILRVMQMMIDCFPSNMIVVNPNIVEYTGGYFGSSRDNFTARACINPPYQNIGIRGLNGLDNYKHITALNPDAGETGTIRYLLYRNNSMIETNLVLFPIKTLADRDLDNIYIEQWYPGETPDEKIKYYARDIEVEINKYDDLRAEYEKVISNTAKYYMDVFKMDKKTAQKNARAAVQIMILQWLYHV